MVSSRKPLTASQAAALRRCIEAYQDAIAWQLPAPLPRPGTAAMLYVMSLVQEAEARTEEERGHALTQRQVSLGKLTHRLGRLPTAEDIEANLEPVEPFDNELRSFLRADLEAPPEG